MNQSAQQKRSLLSEVISALGSVILLAAGIVGLVRTPAQAHRGEYLLLVFLTLMGLYGTVGGIFDVYATMRSSKHQMPGAGSS